MDGLIYTLKHIKIKHSTFTKPLYINVFSDTHEDDSAHDSDGFLDFLKECRKTPKEDTYYLGLGDYHDLASTSEKHAIRVAKLHSTTVEMFDEIAMQNNRRFCKKIEQMRGKLLGLIEGNHHWVYATDPGRGKTSTEDLCERMECEYLGWLSYIILSIEAQGKKITYDFVLCHGKGGGRRAGATINGVEDLKLIWPNADFYIMGDDHQRAARPDSVFEVYVDSKGGITCRQKKQLLCRSGSFVKSYVPGKSGFAMSKLMKPANLWGLQLELHTKREERGNKTTLKKRISAKV